MSDTSSQEAGPSSRTASSVHDIKSEKPPFGSRFLTEDADVWSQNAWDHVPPPDDQDDIIAAALTKQRSAPVPENEKQKYNEKPARHWDNFYKMNQSNFFRNRKWLHLEFPELVEVTKPEAGSICITEIGCGAGNAVFPLLATNRNPQLRLRAYDYASHAVKLVQSNPLYISPPVGSISSAVWDLSSDSLPPDVPPESVDIIILVFVLSALHPHEWSQAISNIHKMLKPGGLVLFRDYGRHDLTQLRFKAGRLMEDNFYIRGDKTRVYFFDLDELALLFTGSPVPSTLKTTLSEVKIEEEDGDGQDSSYTGSPALGHTPSTTSGVSTPIPPLSETTPLGNATAQDAGLEPELGAVTSTTVKQPTVHPSLLSRIDDSSEGTTHPLFTVEQLGVDRRLIVNRKRQLKMYRVWMQGKFRKL